jgi:hypothetical protein
MLFKKLWHKLFGIKRYIRDVHYILDSFSPPEAIFTINIIKGPFKGAQIGFIPDAGDPYRLAIRTVYYNFDIGNRDFTTDSDWCIIAEQIFKQEYDTAIKNYTETRKEILTDEDDRTDYFEEPFPQRTVRTKSGSISKKRVLSRQKRKTGTSRSDGSHHKVQPPANGGIDQDITGE